MLVSSKWRTSVGLALVLALAASGCDSGNNASRAAAAGDGAMQAGGRCLAYIARSAGFMQLDGAPLSQKPRSIQERDQQLRQQAAMNRFNSNLRGGVVGLAAVYPSAAGAAGSILNSGTVGIDLPRQRRAICNGGEPTYIAFATPTTAVVLCKNQGLNNAQYEGANQVNISPNCTIELVAPQPIQTGRDPVKVVFSEEGDYGLIANRGDGSLTVLQMDRPVVTTAKAGVIGAGVFSDWGMNVPLSDGAIRLQLEDLVLQGDTLYTLDTNGNIDSWDVNNLMSMKPYGPARAGLLNVNYGRKQRLVANGVAKNANHLVVVDNDPILSNGLGIYSVFHGLMRADPMSRTGRLNSRRLAESADGNVLSLEGDKLVVYSVEKVTEPWRDSQGGILTTPDGQPILRPLAPALGSGVNRQMRVPGAVDMDWRGYLGAIVAKDDRGAGKVYLSVHHGGANFRMSEFQLTGVVDPKGVAIQPSSEKVELVEKVAPPAESDDKGNDSTKPEEEKSKNGKKGFKAVSSQ